MALILTRPPGHVFTAFNLIKPHQVGIWYFYFTKSKVYRIRGLTQFTPLDFQSVLVPLAYSVLIG